MTTAMSTEPLEVEVRFKKLCRLVGAGRGLTLPAIADCWALAEEGLKVKPDPERIRLFRRRLGLKDEK